MCAVLCSSSSDHDLSISCRSRQPVSPGLFELFSFPTFGDTIQQSKVVPMITQKRPDQKQDAEDQFSSAQGLLMPALPPGSIYSDGEVHVLGPLQKMR
jgi:hypothetical protein